MICNPYEIVIQGLTSEGRTFRPSDWAERLSQRFIAFWWTSPKTTICVSLTAAPWSTKFTPTSFWP